MNHCVISQTVQEFSLNNISTDPGTQGIDGIGIIVNGKFIEATQEVDDLIEKNKYLNATFVFIQTKTSSKFEGSQIANFSFAVKHFFNGNGSVFKGPNMENFLSLKEHIYSNASSMTKGNPICKLYFVTTGKWTNEAAINAIVTQSTDELYDTNLFREIQFIPLGANEIQKYYRKTKESVSAEFTFERRVTLPKIDKITESYFGYIPFKEFVKLVGDDGSIRSIFYDNVRDFLGDNPVNQKIKTTLEDKKFDLFAVLNNGVTLVADNITVTGDKFTINDYQVVNGCQTSHVLFNNKDTNGIEKMIIPIRLIVTDNDDIKNEITKATNSQTEVKPEQLEALSEFQKKLEHYYRSIEGNGKLYYERRTNQYSNDNKVIKSRIISIRYQIKAFASMFLDNPHQVSGYYGTVAQRLETEIFSSKHNLSPYYTSGLAYYQLELLYRNLKFDSNLKKIRYHLLMLFRLLANKEKMPDIGSKKIDKYCQVLVEKLNDSNECEKIFREAIDIIEKSSLNMNNSSHLKQKEKTDELKKLFE